MGEWVCKRLLIRHKEASVVDIAFSIESSLALVGESGSGKSLTLKALLGMLPAGFTAQMDITSDFPLRRGETLGYVPQNPFTALSPLTRIQDQWIVGAQRAKERMAQVGLDPALLTRFPPELSGGQLQRVVIAMALSSSPRLLLLDEPTTALDAALRSTVVELLLQLQKNEGFLMLFVTHDIATAAALCEEMTVIRSGRVVEHGPTALLTADPANDYTRALMEANFANREFRR